MVNYSDLLRAAGTKKRNLPTVKAQQWSTLQQDRLQRNLCVACGNVPINGNSYRCPACESRETIADIRNELDSIRKRLLGSG